MKKLGVISRFIWMFCPLAALAQAPDTYSSSDILLRIKKLRVLGTVLYIAAHPDDENTRLLAWLSKDQLYRTGYLSLTRGDGGQNLIGEEQGVELGLIRTQELLAARRVDGAEQFFSRAYDFGFSKSTEEALRIWNEQKILSDVVWVIRKFQPDVIITRFPEDKRAGHGQHSASAVLARMAYAAAADPQKFPEQFAFGVGPWQARRLFWNNYNFGRTNTTSEDQLKIEVGGFNTLAGKSYGEIAADSRSQHKSQGFGLAHSRGNVTEYFSIIGGDSAKQSLLENIDVSWNRIPGGKPIGKLVDKLISSFNPQAPAASLPMLISLYDKLNSLPESYWRNRKLKEVQELIRACSGLWLEANVGGGYVRQNKNLSVTLRVLNRSLIPVRVEKVILNGQDTIWHQDLNPGVNYSIARVVSLKGLPISQPYWLVEPMSPGSFNVNNQELIGRAENPPALEAVFQVALEGRTFEFHQAVIYKYTDAVKGELFEPLTIVPDQMAYCDPDLMVFTKGKETELTVNRQWKTKKDTETVMVHPASVSGTGGTASDQSFIKITPVPGFEISSLGSSPDNFRFMLRSENELERQTGSWAVKATEDGSDTLQQCRTISYEHIPRIDYFRAAHSNLLNLDLAIRGTRIGYIEGAGDRVAEALRAMGYTVEILNEKSVNPSVLKNLDAVVTGVRAYDVHDWLTEKYPVLMDYVKNGGNLIVQYNRNPDDSTRIGPYPFVISNTRVAEEDATVNVILPDHPLMHFPNQITTKDFAGWVQERGIYFAQRADPNYQSVFSMHDTGEADQRGSLITCRYGKGNFTYTGLVFFRELPAGIPGAYRLFANLIALNQNGNK